MTTRINKKTSTINKLNCSIDKLYSTIYNSCVYAIQCSYNFKVYNIQDWNYLCNTTGRTDVSFNNLLYLKSIPLSLGQNTTQTVLRD